MISGTSTHLCERIRVELHLVQDRPAEGDVALREVQRHLVLRGEHRRFALWNSNGVHVRPVAGVTDGTEPNRNEGMEPSQKNQIQRNQPNRSKRKRTKALRVSLQAVGCTYRAKGQQRKHEMYFESHVYVSMCLPPGKRSVRKNSATKRDRLASYHFAILVNHLPNIQLKPTRGESRSSMATRAGPVGIQHTERWCASPSVCVLHSLLL